MSRITALVYFVLYCLALPVIVLRLLLAPGRARLLQRLGFALPPAGNGTIWLHASSVGEVALLEELVARFERDLPDVPLLITAFTATGISTAQKKFPRHSVSALPFDIGMIVARYVRRVNPRLCIVIEGEFWPALLSTMRNSKVPIAVVNGRISERSMNAHIRTGFVAQPLRSAAVIAVQDSDNAQRFEQLGISNDRIHVTGNMKYDLVSPMDRKAARAAFGIDETATVIVGGSLHEREDEIFLNAVFDPEPVSASTVALIAPRYTHTAAQVCAAARARGLRAVLRTQTGDAEAGNGSFDVCVIDTFGELRALYSIADIVFVGGSLFDRGSGKGGHNLMEPAICGVPVLFGPFNYSFSQVAGELERAGGGKLVRSGDELRAQLQRISADLDTAVRMGAAAKAVVLAGQGATARNLDLIRGLLEQRSL